MGKQRSFGKSALRWGLAVVLIVGVTGVGVRWYDYSQYHRLKRSVAQSYRVIRQQASQLADSLPDARSKLPSDLSAGLINRTQIAMLLAQACAAERLTDSQGGELLRLASRSDNHGELGVLSMRMSEPVFRNAQGRSPWARKAADAQVTRLVEDARRANQLAAQGERAVSQAEKAEDDFFVCVFGGLAVAAMPFPDLPASEAEEYVRSWWAKVGAVSSASVRARAQLAVYQVTCESVPKVAAALTPELLQGLSRVEEAGRRGRMLGAACQSVLVSEEMRATGKTDFAVIAEKWAAQAGSAKASADLLASFCDSVAEYSVSEDFPGRLVAESDYPGRAITKRLLPRVEQYVGKLSGGDRSWAMCGVAVQWVSIDNARAFKLLSSNIGGLRESSNLLWDLNYGQKLLDYFAAMAAENPELALRQYAQTNKPNAYSKAMAAVGMLGGLPGSHWEKVADLTADAVADSNWADVARQLAAVTLVSGKQVEKGLQMLGQIKNKEMRRLAISNLTDAVAPEQAHLLLPILAALPEKEKRETVQRLLGGVEPPQAWALAQKALPEAAAASALREAFAGPVQSMSFHPPGIGKPPLLAMEKTVALVDGLKEEGERSFVAATLLEDVLAHDAALAVDWVAQRVLDPFWRIMAAEPAIRAATDRSREQWQWALQPAPEDNFVTVLIHGLSPEARQQLTRPAPLILRGEWTTETPATIRASW